MCPILAFESPTFQPAMRIVTGITNADPMVVTTSFDHDYETGLIVRLWIPNAFGMIEADSLIAAITVLSSDTFSLPFDSTYFNLFASPTTFPDNYQQAQVVPVGEINSSLDQATRNVL